MVEGSAENVKLIMISEALPKDIQDYFYSADRASFFQTTQTVFADAGYEIKHPREFIEKGIYLTTAIKCTKKDYLVSADTIKTCSLSLERELEMFKNARVIMCMGDFAIKAVNYIFKRKTGARVIPAGSTYKIRDHEYIHHGIRFYPSYTQTGDSFNLEKSKRSMIAEDIRSAIEYLIKHELAELEKLVDELTDLGLYPEIKVETIGGFTRNSSSACHLVGSLVSEYYQRLERIAKQSASENRSGGRPNEEATLDFLELPGDAEPGEQNLVSFNAEMRENIKRLQAFHRIFQAGACSSLNPKQVYDSVSLVAIVHPHIKKLSRL